METPKIEARVNLKGMIRLDQVEDLLTSLMSRIDSQEQRIVQLQQMCAFYSKRADVESQFEELSHQMNKISTKLETVHSYATANIGNDTRVPAGELSYLNNLQLQQLSKKLSEYALQSTLTDEVKKISNKCQIDIASICNWAAPMSLAVKLEEQASNLTGRVDDMQLLMNRKVDKTELSRLETLCSKLEHYSRFMDTTLQSIESVQNQVSVQHADIELLTSNQRGLQELSKVLQLELSKTALKSEIRSVAKELNLHSNLLSQCASKEQMNMTTVRLSDTEKKANLLLTNLTSLQEKVDTMLLQLREKASILDMNQRVTMVKYSEDLDKIARNMDTRSTIMELTSSNARIKKLEEMLQEESVRISLAVRFVDWFTSRGVNYEHNVRIIDKHLEKLTSSSHPQLRPPFNDTIRYTPVVPMKTSHSET